MVCNTVTSVTYVGFAISQLSYVVYIGDGIARVAARKDLTQTAHIALGVGSACTGVDGEVVPFKWVYFVVKTVGPPGAFESDVNRD